jgi:mono/diheme cytochrome c family protein
LVIFLFLAVVSGVREEELSKKVISLYVACLLAVVSLGYFGGELVYGTKRPAPELSEASVQTYVSGTVTTADGRVVASGAVALEKGELHNNAFLAGGAIKPDGTFRIPLPSGGPWGLHVYSEKYIYFPLQIQVTAGVDNDVPAILPVDGTTADDPKISNIQFKKLSDQAFTISMQVDDPDNNLGPQMLAIDAKRYKSYRLLPKSGDLADVKADFPNGEYVSPPIPVALDAEDFRDWLLVVADHQCSNGVVYNGLGQSVFKPTTEHSETLSCEVPGIWKTNYDELYRFSQAAPGELKGEHFEGGVLIDKMVQKGDQLSIAFRFEGMKGKGELKLQCQASEVLLKGTFQTPDRLVDWVFTKLKNAPAALTGEKLFSANCSACHFPDRKDQKVGPGLLGLFKSPKLPQSGLPATEENIRWRIINGGEKMPPFKHLTEEELKAVVDYLKTL